MRWDRNRCRRAVRDEEGKRTAHKSDRFYARLGNVYPAPVINAPWTVFCFASRHCAAQCTHSMSTCCTCCTCCPVAVMEVFWLWCWWCWWCWRWCWMPVVVICYYSYTCPGSPRCCPYICPCIYPAALDASHTNAWPAMVDGDMNSAKPSEGGVAGRQTTFLPFCPRSMAVVVAVAVRRSRRLARDAAPSSMSTEITTVTTRVYSRRNSARRPDV